MNIGLTVEQFLRDIEDSGKLTPLPEYGMRAAMDEFQRWASPAERYIPKAVDHRRNAELYRATCFARGLKHTVGYLSIIASRPDRNLSFKLSHVTARSSFPEDSKHSAYYAPRYRAAVDLSPSTCDQSNIWDLDNRFNNRVGFYRLQGIAVDLVWPWDLERFHDEVERRRNTTAKDLIPHTGPSSQPIQLHLLFSIAPPTEFAWVTVETTGIARYERMFAQCDSDDSTRANAHLFVSSALGFTEATDTFSLNCGEGRTSSLSRPSIDLLRLGEDLSELGDHLNKVNRAIKPQRKLGSVMF